MHWLGKTKKAALKTRAAALLSSKLGTPSETRGGIAAPPQAVTTTLPVRSRPGGIKT